MNESSSGAADPWGAGGATSDGFIDNGNQFGGDQFGDGGAFGQEGGPSDNNCRK